MTYENLVSLYEKNPRDIPTVPRNRQPVWFYVSADCGNLYAEPAREHSPSSRIRFRRRLQKKELEPMLKLYERRKKGEPVSREATQLTVNQVYWYGIFADAGL